jgi:hypothetical protein
VNGNVTTTGSVPGADYDEAHVTTINGSQVGSDNALQVAGRETQAYVRPVLQHENGDYIAWASSRKLIAFNAAGAVKWTKEVLTGADPLYALADGSTVYREGVYRNIPKELVTVDANGNEVSRINDEGTVLSWIQNSYRPGSAISFAREFPPLANSFVSVGGGNYSNSTASKQAFPALPQPQGNSIWNAYSSLISQLRTDIGCRNAAKQFVFRIFNEDANHEPADVDNFIRYLTTINRLPHISDGTQSSWDFKNAWCGRGWGSWNTFGNCASPFLGTISDDFRTQLLDDAITETPSWPFTVFFRPSSIETVNDGKTLENEAMFFHEALHGFTAKSDLSLLDGFGYKQSDPSQKVTDYIREYVLSSCPIGRPQ